MFAVKTLFEEAFGSPHFTTAGSSVPSCTRSHGRAQPSSSTPAIAGIDKADVILLIGSNRVMEGVRC